MADLDMASLLYADEPTAREKSQALAAALRGQATLGYLSQLTGDPAASRFGESISRAAQHQQDQLAELPQSRAKLALEGQQLGKATRENEAMADPRTATVLRNAFRAAGLQVDDDVPAAALALPVMRYLAQAREASEARKAQYTGLNFFKQQALADREDKQTAAQMRALGDSLDPLNRSSGLAKVSQRMQAIESGLGGVIAPGDDLNSLNSQKIYELARVYDRVVSAGQPTQGGTSHLVPSTALGSAADFLQWFKGSPQGRNQGAFAKQMIDALGREKDIASGQIAKSQQSKVARAAALYKKDPQGFRNTLTAAGLNPDDFDQETWNYRAPTAPDPAAPAPGPQGVPAPKIDPGIVQKYKASLQPGERLVVDPTGNAHALGQGEALPQGFTEVP